MSESEVGGEGMGESEVGGGEGRGESEVRARR